MADDPTKPTYAQIEQENIRLRARIVELEGNELMRQAEEAGRRKRETIRIKLDPTAKDRFQRPAYK